MPFSQQHEIKTWAEAAQSWQPPSKPSRPQQPVQESSRNSCIHSAKGSHRPSSSSSSPPPCSPTSSSSPSTSCSSASSWSRSRFPFLFFAAGWVFGLAFGLFLAAGLIFAFGFGGGGVASLLSTPPIAAAYAELKSGLLLLTISFSSRCSSRFSKAYVLLIVANTHIAHTLAQANKSQLAICWRHVTLFTN